MKSKDMTVTDVLKKIKEINFIEEINAFIEGDVRKTVIDTAQRRIKSLTAKQGEDVGPITQKASDFKEGIEGTKDMTPPLPPLNLRGGREELRGGDEGGEVKTYITGEDVIKTLRAQGKKI